LAGLKTQHPKKLAQEIRFVLQQAKKHYGYVLEAPRWKIQRDVEFGAGATEDHSSFESLKLQQQLTWAKARTIRTDVGQQIGDLL
jgi:hypothetical protein